MRPSNQFERLSKLFGSTGRLRRTAFVPSIGAAVIGLALTFSAWYAVHQRENRLAHQEFDARADDHFLVLQNGIDQYINDVSALRAAFEAFEHGVSRREFQSFSDYLFRDKNAIFSTSWIPRVQAERTFGARTRGRS